MKGPFGTQRREGWEIASRAINTLDARLLPPSRSLMNRREFLGGLAAAGLLPSRTPAATAFPVHYARATAYDSLLRYVAPGTDEFRGEKEAANLEERMTRIFSGAEPAPPALRSWLVRRGAIRAARFHALPDSQVRFEIKIEDRGGLEYHTGVWKLPDFAVVSHDSMAAARPYFRDVTAHVFGSALSFKEQLLHGNPYWRARLDSALGTDVDGNQGIAVGDIDNDGLDEIYVCQTGGLPNRLYKMRADGTAQDITERSGLGVLDETTSALFVDFRNSGLQDLVVLRFSGPLLFLNQGNGAFRELPDAFHFKTAPQGSFTGMAAADYDRDGRVDLYLCCYVYVQGEDQYQFPTPYHDARNGPPNFLLHNRLTRDGGSFEDVTEESGIHENNDRFSFAPAWCDFDGDGWPDLYVANDFGRNNLYRNRTGRFTDEAAKAGVEDIGAGMSASWFDYDGDARPDLYISNMWTAAGQRVVRDPAFKPAAGNEEAYRRHTKGNSLYRNAGDGTFEETGPRENVEMGRWAWSSGGFDFDLDGAPEILVATGMVTQSSSQELNSFYWRQVVSKSPSTAAVVPAYENGWNAIGQMFRGDYCWSGHEANVFYVRKDGRYRDASGISGVDFSDDSRAFAVTDFDSDGNPDIILKSRLAPQVRALQNDCAQGRPAIVVLLRGTNSNRDAIGARVEVNGQVQFVTAGSGFLSQHSKRLHFGLAGRDRATVKITWPSGFAQDVAALEPGYAYTIVEGSSEHARSRFRTRRIPASAPVAGNNTPAFADTWLLEPVPTPDKRKGPGFVVLHAGDLASSTRIPSSIPVEAIDLSREKDEVAATYSLFRRYLFDYRSDLALPLVLLIDRESRARKVYATVPTEAAMHADLARMDRHRDLALPFSGRYFTAPQRSYFKLGAAFYWAGYPDRALPYLEEALRAKPDNWKAMLAIGQIHQELGHADQALAAFQRAVAAHPNYAPALVSTGMAFLAQRDRASAHEMFLKAVEVDPGNADAANQLGLLAAQANDLDNARQWFQRAVEAQPENPGIVNNLAVLYAQMGQNNDSIAAFRYGIQNNPDNEPLYLNLAQIYIRMGDRDEARAVLTQLLDRVPGSTLARRTLDQLDGR